MKKILTASIASLLLVAGVAAAQSDSAVVRVGDRLGSASDVSNDLQGSNNTLLIVGGVVLIAVVIAVAVGSSHGSNNNSVSP